MCASTRANGVSSIPPRCAAPGKVAGKEPTALRRGHTMNEHDPHTTSEPDGCVCRFRRSNDRVFSYVCGNPHCPYSKEGGRQK